MSRRRPARPKTVAFAEVADIVSDTMRLWSALEIAPPKTARIWKRHDGVTVRIASRTKDGLAVSSTVKLRRR